MMVLVTALSLIVILLLGVFSIVYKKEMQTLRDIYEETEAVSAKRIATLNEYNASLEDAKAKSDAQLQVVKKELEVYKNNSVQLTELADESVQQLEELNHQMHHANSRAARLEEERSALERENTILQKEIDRLRETKDHKYLLNRLNQQEALIEELQSPKEGWDIQSMEHVRH